jgi:hypothetical protein
MWFGIEVEVDGEVMLVLIDWYRRGHLNQWYCPWSLEVSEAESCAHALNADLVSILE